jgi:hypothetical protein
MIARVAGHPPKNRHRGGDDVSVDPGRIDGDPAARRRLRLGRELAEQCLLHDLRQDGVALPEPGRLPRSPDPRGHARRQSCADACRQRLPRCSGCGLDEQVAVGRLPKDGRLLPRDQQLVRADVLVGDDAGDPNRPTGRATASRTPARPSRCVDLQCPTRPDAPQPRGGRAKDRRATLEPSSHALVGRGQEGRQGLWCGRSQVEWDGHSCRRPVDHVPVAVQRPGQPYSSADHRNGVPHAGQPADPRREPGGQPARCPHQHHLRDLWRRPCGCGADGWRGWRQCWPVRAGTTAASG